MYRSFLAGLAVLLCVTQSALAQTDAIVHEGEFGISAGAAHYFGDLNPDFHFNRPKPAVGIFYRKQFGNYVALRIAGHFAMVGYSDVYNTQNQFFRERNLSFDSQIWELTAQGDFNFFKFVPGDGRYRYTPYITFGVGVFNFNPYAYLNGVKYYLQPLGTEGQGSAEWPGRKPYSTTAMCFPLGLGIKYNLNPSMNIGFELVYRFTTTDYLDDVSTTYAGAENFVPGTAAYALQDRSGELGGTAIGIKGRQRGYSNQNDGYLMGEVMLTVNLKSYKCPTTKGGL